MNLDNLTVGVAPPDDINVVIEVPLGGEPIKYEIDKASELPDKSSNSPAPKPQSKSTGQAEQAEKTE